MPVFWFTQSVDDNEQTVCLKSRDWDAMANGDYTTIASFQNTVAGLILKEYSRDGLINLLGQESVREGDFL